jgi:hypothetical protein
LVLAVLAVTVADIKAILATILFLVRSHQTVAVVAVVALPTLAAAVTVARAVVLVNQLVAHQ